MKTVFVAWFLSVMILVPCAKRTWPGRDVAAYLVMASLFAPVLALLVKVMRS